MPETVNHVVRKVCVNSVDKYDLPQTRAYDLFTMQYKLVKTYIAQPQ